jgi:hypothetical protein
MTQQGIGHLPGRHRGGSTRTWRRQMVGAALGPVGARSRQSEDLDHTRIHRSRDRGRVPAAQPVDGIASGIAGPPRSQEGYRTGGSGSGASFTPQPSGAGALLFLFGDVASVAVIAVMGVSRGGLRPSAATMAVVAIGRSRGSEDDPRGHVRGRDRVGVGFWVHGSHLTWWSSEPIIGGGSLHELDPTTLASAEDGSRLEV